MFSLQMILDKLLRIGVALLLIAIPLYPKFPIVNISNTYVAIRLEDFLIGFVVGLWIIKLVYLMVRTKHWSLFCKSFFGDTIKRSIILFWVAGFVSLLSAFWITQSVLPHIGMLHAFRRVEYMIVFFVALSTIRSKDDIRFYVEVILLTAFLVFVYALGQKLAGWPIISTMNREYSKGIALNIISGGRINSTFAGHYDLAAYTVLLLNILAALVFSVKKWTFRLWIILVTVSVFWMLLMSASRISFAAYLGSIGVTLWFMKKRLWIVPVILVSVMFSSLAPSLFSRYSEAIQYEFAPRFAALNDFLQGDSRDSGSEESKKVTPTPVIIAGSENNGVDPKDIDRKAGDSKKVGPSPTSTPTLGPRKQRYVAEEVFIPEDRSTAIRFKVEWPRAIRAFTKNPVWGTGYSSITLATDNDYLRMLGEIGLVGFFSFVLLILALFSRVKKRVFNYKGDFYNALVIGIAGGSVGFMANAVFIDVFVASKVATYFWLLMALMVGTVGVIKKKNSN